MALKNLENLVLRGVPAVLNGGTESKRIGCDQAMGTTPVSLSFACDPSSSHPEPNQPRVGRCHDRMADACERAGRPGGFQGVLASRSLASEPATATAALGDARSWRGYRGRPLAIGVPIAPHGNGRQQPDAMPTAGIPLAHQARFEPDAWALTASRRGERKR